jgi:hypothetical protein
MNIRTWSSCLVLTLLSANPASAQLVKGVMAIKGAEMS